MFCMNIACYASCSLYVFVFPYVFGRRMHTQLYVEVGLGIQLGKSLHYFINKARICAKFMDFELVLYIELLK